MAGERLDRAGQPGVGGLHAEHSQELRQIGNHPIQRRLKKAVAISWHKRSELTESLIRKFSQGFEVVVSTFEKGGIVLWAVSRFVLLRMQFALINLDCGNSHPGRRK